MQTLARAVGRRKEAVAQVQLIPGTGKFIINTKAAHEYLQNDSCAILEVQAPFAIYQKTNGVASESNQETNTSFSDSVQNQTSTLTEMRSYDTIVKVKGGGLKGQAEAIRLGIARALCVLENNSTTESNKEATLDIQDNNAAKTGVNVGLRKQLKDKGFLTQDSRVKERRKYGLKKARKASQYHKR